MMKYGRFTWKTEKLQHSDDEVIMVVDNANEDWKGHILNVIDMLNELNDERMMYKTTIDKRIVELEDENEQLKEERNYFERKKCEYFNKYNKKHLDNIQLKEENEQLKQKIQRWKNLYEIKDAEVTARVDALNKVCEYYTSEVLFKSDTDPNRAVKEVLNEILNTEVKK